MVWLPGEALVVMGGPAWIAYTWFVAHCLCLGACVTFAFYYVAEPNPLFGSLSRTAGALSVLSFVGGTFCVLYAADRYGQPPVHGSDALFIDTTVVVTLLGWSLAWVTTMFSQVPFETQVYREVQRLRAQKSL